STFISNNIRTRSFVIENSFNDDIIFLES
ncbi:unnamed protein product, partial [Rotaria sp. Silwood1]